jgi:hypothetical protein
MHVPGVLTGISCGKPIPYPFDLRGEKAMLNIRLITAAISTVLLAGASSAFAWNLEARYVNALRFQKDGTIQFTLFESGTSGGEFICDPSIPTVPVEGGGQWFVISACDTGHGKGNHSASPACLSTVDRMAEMLLEAKTAGIPVHVTRDLCSVTETALKPL